MEDDERTLDIFCTTALIKVRSLLQLGSYMKANDLAVKTVKKKRSFASLTTYFECLLQPGVSSNSEEIIQRFLGVCRSEPTQDFAVEDQLKQIAVCCAFLYKKNEFSPKLKVSLIKSLLKAWMEMYVSNKWWRCHSEVDIATDNEGNLHLSEVLIEYNMLINDYKNDNMQASGMKNNCSFNFHCLSHFSEGDTPKVQLTSIHQWRDMLGQIREGTNLLKLVIDNVIMEEKELSSIGPLHNLLWIADFYYSLGVEVSSLLKETFGKLPTSDYVNYSLTACDYFSISHVIYKTLPVAFYPTKSKSQMSCNLLMAMSHLDIASVMASENEHSSQSQSQSAISSTSVDESLQNARQCAFEAVILARNHMDFADEIDIDIGNKAVVVLFATYCFPNHSSNCGSFLQQNKQELLHLDILDLKSCVDIASNSCSFSAESMRSLLDIAIQVAVKQSKPCPFVGEFYRRLIELAPTRKYALDKVTEFQQLVSSVARSTMMDTSDTVSRDDNNRLFFIEDIDAIISMTYNYGIALIDIDQIDIAQEFLLSTLRLSEYASEAMRAWMKNIQVRCLRVINCLDSN